MIQTVTVTGAAAPVDDSTIQTVAARRPVASALELKFISLGASWGCRMLTTLTGSESNPGL